MQGFSNFFFPAAAKLMSSLVFKCLLVIMLNKATLLSPCLGPLDVLAPICKNSRGDCRHNSVQWLWAVLSILRLTEDQRGNSEAMEFGLPALSPMNQSAVLLILFSMQILFSLGVNHLPGVPTLGFLNERAGADSQASGMSRG